MVLLNCAIVNLAGSVVEVDIDVSKSVSALKKAIKEEKPNDLMDVDADKLQLFLAKKDGAWLDGAGAAAVALDEDGTLRGYGDQMEPTLWIKNARYFGENFQPGEGQVHVLVVVPEDPPGLEHKRKRRRMDDAPDAWMKALKEEQVQVLPSTCEDLKAHLERRLRVKVPITERLFQLISAQNTTGECTSTFDKLFEPEPRETLSDGTVVVLAPVVDPLGSGSEFATESTYIHLWDSLIAALLRRVSNGNFRRNTNESTCTGLSRPDLCFYCDKSNVCVFRGEEKASGPLEVPIKELHDELTWRYDAAPYIFGYAAVGLRVCLVAIRKDDMTECGAKVEIIETYDLGRLFSRLSFFLALLNLSTLFRPVVDLIQQTDIPEYGVIERVNGVRIAFTQDCVVKTYPSSMPSDTIIRNLMTLHGLMEKVPNVVKLRGTNMKKKHVVLEPIGQLFPPKNVHQLLMALRDILMALVALHAIKLMHRDLRWENVLKYLGKGDKWFLIDFDEGASSPARRIDHLNAESHAPEIQSSSSHSVKVDIWSVGFLLKTSPVQDLPAELEAMKEKCLQKNPNKRPTAKSLLKVIESLIES